MLDRNRPKSGSNKNIKNTPTNREQEYANMQQQEQELQEEEQQRVAAVQALRLIRSCLDQVTELTTVKEHNRLEAPCGFCELDTERNLWQVFHRPMTNDAVGGILGGFPPPTLVARLCLPTRPIAEEPEKAVVKLLLRRAELEHMLQQMRLHSHSFKDEIVNLPCRTGHEVDFVPLLQSLCGVAAPSVECMRHVTDLTVACCFGSDHDEQNDDFGVYAVKWATPRRPVNKQDAYYKAAQRLSHACIRPNLVESNSTSSSSSSSPRHNTNERLVDTNTQDENTDGLATSSTTKVLTSPEATNGVVEAPSRITRTRTRQQSQSEDEINSRATAKESPASIQEGNSPTAKRAKSTHVSSNDHVKSSKKTDESADASVQDVQPASGMRTRHASKVDSSSPDATTIRVLRKRSAPIFASKPPSSSQSETKPIMILRKQTAQSKDAMAYETSTTGHISVDLRRCVDVGECEVCLRPYALSYLSKHRHKVHGLTSKLFGCPYCDQIALSEQERESHIQRAHRGQPSKWSIDGTSNVKVQMYPCPLCPAQFTLRGLVCHLPSCHQESVDSFRGRILCTCPFCMTSAKDGKRLATYKSVDDLRSHVSSKHKGCLLLDDVNDKSDPIELRKSKIMQRATTKNLPAAARRKQPSRAQPSTTKEAPLSEGRDCDATSEEKNPSPDELGNEPHWEKLDYTGLIADYAYGDFAPTSFGLTLGSAIEAVEKQLEVLESNNATNDDDYAAEMKLYQKGLKDRQQMADAERIEKERHREEVERKLMQLQYENRHKHKKKKTPVELEFNAFLARPAYFPPARASTRKYSCPLGDECELCVSDTHKPETDAFGQLIYAPSCDAKAVNDSWKNAAEQAEASSESGARSRRRGRGLNATARSILMLKEMKHSLRFISKYNEGYFKR